MCMLRRVHHVHVRALSVHTVCMHMHAQVLQNVQPCFHVVVGDAANMLGTLEMMFGSHHCTANKLSCVVDYLQGSCTESPPDVFGEPDIYFEQVHKLSITDVPRLQLLVDKGMFTEDAERWALEKINDLHVAG